MPQLATETFASQIFWVLLGFALVYLFVSTVAFPELHDIMRNRVVHIESLFKSAEKTKSEATEIERQSRMELENAQLDASTKEAQLMSEFLEKSRAQKATFQERINRESRNKAKELEEDVSKTFQEICSSSDDLVEQAVKRISRGSRSEY